MDPGHLKAGLGVEEEEIRDEVAKPVPARVRVRGDGSHLIQVMLNLKTEKPEGRGGHNVNMYVLVFF